MHIIEEVFFKCRSNFRVFKVLLSNEWLSLYEIRKEIGIHISREYLYKLVRLNLLEYDELFNKYRIRKDSLFIEALEEFYRKIGY